MRLVILQERRKKHVKCTHGKVGTDFQTLLQIYLAQPQCLNTRSDRLEVLKRTVKDFNARHDMALFSHWQLVQVHGEQIL